MKMGIVPRAVAMGLLAVAFAVTGAAATPGFQDVLDTPALKSPLAAKVLLNAVALAGKRLVSVGQRGHILYSDDQGRSWIQAGVPVSSDLVAVHFPSPRKGWAVGHDGVVLHSADGGVNWAKQFDGRAAAQTMTGYYAKHPPAVVPGGADSAGLREAIKQCAEQGPDKSFTDVWFENETTGFVVGAFNLIFRTSDGGRSWEPWFDRTENPKFFHMYAIRRIGQDLFISGEQGLVMKLDHKAGRFRALKMPYKGTLFGITGRQGTAIVFGLRGNAFRSRDGGASWQKVKTGVQVGLTGGAAAEDGRIVLVSQEGHVLVSADDGVNFHQAKVGRPIPASAVMVLDKNALVLAGLLGVQVQRFE